MVRGPGLLHTPPSLVSPRAARPVALCWPSVPSKLPSLTAPVSWACERWTWRTFCSRLPPMSLNVPELAPGPDERGCSWALADRDPWLWVQAVIACYKTSTASLTAWP